MYVKQEQSTYTIFPDACFVSTLKKVQVINECASLHINSEAAKRRVEGLYFQRPAIAIWVIWKVKKDVRCKAIMTCKLEKYHGLDVDITFDSSVAKPWCLQGMNYIFVESRTENSTCGT